MNGISLRGLSESVYTRIVRLVLEEKGLGYDFIETDVFDTNRIPRSFHKLNPFIRIPVLKHDSLVIYETIAITTYIDDTFSDKRLTPVSPPKKAKMIQLISILDSYAYTAMIKNCFVSRIVRQNTDYCIDNDIKMISTCIQELEQSLSDQDYLLGDVITLADFHAVPMLYYFSQTPDSKEMLLNSRLNKWIDRMVLRDSFLNTKSIYG